MTVHLVVFLFMVQLYGCSSVPKKVQKIDLKQKSDTLFSELEKEEKDISRLPQTKPSPKSLKNEPSGGAAGEVFNFEETGTGFASKYERAIESEKRAEDDALSKAFRKTGVDVYYGFSDVLAQYGETKYQFVARYLYTWTGAVVEYERVGEPQFVTLPSGEIKCALKLKGKIHIKGQPDPAYEIRDFTLNQPVYYDGNEVRISFRSTKDSYVHLLVIDEEQNAILIYPNKYEGSNFIKAGQIFNFPDDKSNITIKAVLPEGKKETIELLHIILTKNLPIFSSDETKEVQIGEYKQFSAGDLSSTSKRLARQNRSDWTMVVLPYTIKSR
ncbi:MAG: DUF4384 domain-containing protein [Elusimicrobiota bacterium]